MIRVEESRIKSYLTMYKFPENTKKEIIKTLNYYHGLICNFETFLFSNRIEKKLVNLSGTVPVTFKGTTYHIPICIWLMDTHPNNAPICYVKPTLDMRIKMSMYVDHNGKIYLPYLHNWTPTTSNLLDLIGIMTATFSETPPVYSVVRTEQPVNPGYPTQMPYGGTGSNVMLPYSSIPTSSTATSNPSTAYHGSSNTPYPLYNNQFPTPSPYPTGSANTSNFPPYTAPYTTQNSSQNCPYPQQPAPIRPEYPPYPSTTSNLPNPSTGLNDGGTITEEHIKAGSYGTPSKPVYHPPPPKDSYGAPPSESYGTPSKDSYGIPALGFIDNSLQIQYGSPSGSSYNGLPPEGTFGTPIAICCGTPPPDLPSQKPSDSQYGLTYGQASGRQIPGPNLQPKNPVKNRAPVPPGLVESTQYNSFQGEPYIPPPVSEVSTGGNDAYAAPSSSTGYSSSNNSPDLEQSPIVPQDQQQYNIQATQDTPNNGVYNQGLSTSYAIPAPESYQHITQTVSVNSAAQEPNNYVQPNQLLTSNVDNYGAPQQSFDLNQQIEESKNNPQLRDTENNSQQPENNNYQHQPDGVDVNDIVKSLGLEGSSVVGSKSVDINGLQEYPVQGSTGNYMLQIQPGQRGSENIAHDQVLSNGLLQDILSAIENQQKSDNSYDNQPQGSEVRQVATSASNSSTEWPENSASKKQEMALFYSTRDGKGQSTQGKESLLDEINHLSVNEVSNGNFVSYKSPKVNYVYSESTPQAVSQEYPQQSTPKTDESSTNSLSSTGK